MTDTRSSSDAVPAIDLTPWDDEQQTLGPGLQSVVQWGRLHVDHGVGDHLVSRDGTRYLDFQGGAGVNLVGHSHPRVVTAVQRQAEQWMVGSWTSDARVELMSRLRAVLPAPLNAVQLYSSGTEAVEAALRLARSATGAHEILSFWGGFHGKSLGSMAMTTGGPRRGLGPLPSGYHTTPFANSYRCSLTHPDVSCGQACAEFAERTLEHNSVGALAAIVVEVVQGRAGNVVAAPGFLPRLQSLARRTGALFVVDESMTGFGRTGRMFAFEHEGLEPDIVIVGKGLGSGYPITAVISSRDVMSSGPFGDPSASSSSFGGFPGACAAASATLEVLVGEGLTARAGLLGGSFITSLRAALADAPAVGDVRGLGLAVGIELVEDRVSKAPVAPRVVREVYEALLAAGLIVMTGGNCLRLYPPLDVAEESLERAITILVDVLGRRP